jgi:hypothetical protein
LFDLSEAGQLHGSASRAIAWFSFSLNVRSPQRILQKSLHVRLDFVPPGQDLNKVVETSLVSFITGRVLNLIPGFDEGVNRGWSQPRMG